MKLEDALSQLARETKRARGRLALERLLRAGLVLLLAAAGWTSIALFGVHERLAPLLQSLTAIAAVLGLAWLAARARSRWRRPTDEDARARLTADAHLDAGAFDSLRDQPARFDTAALALWRRDRERALTHVAWLRAGPLRPRLDEIDPFKLRYAAALALMAGLVVAGLAAPDRLARAFLPNPGPLLGDRAMVVEAWLTPASYTGAAPVSISDRLDERVVTPPSVEATVRVAGPVGAPILVFEGRGGRRNVAFTRAADGAWEARLALPGPGRLKVVRFHTEAQWRIAPGADQRPSVAFAAPIAQLNEEIVQVAWRARDDFGVRGLALRVTPVAPPPGLERADPVDTAIESPAGDPREAEAQIDLDLASHPYAGMQVEARLVAFDALGQEGLSDPLRITLPEKVFLQPLARAAIEIRRHILAERRPYRQAPRERVRTIMAGDILTGAQTIDVRDTRRSPPSRGAPAGVQRAARLVDALTMTPEDGYYSDLAVYLGFRYARAELAAAESIGDTDAAADTLWRTALRAEYGGAADARRALEEAQRQLAEALASGAPPERIRQLVEALRRATDAYLQALVQEALRNGERANLEDTEESANISGQDIEQLLREVQRLSEQGRTAEAQALLALLAQILANLDVQLASGQGGGEGGPQDQAMQESMDELSETMGEQRALRDQTQQQQQSGQQDGQGGGGGQQQGGQSGSELAERQAQIRQGLAGAQEMADEAGAGESPDLDAAGQAMGRAEEALRRGDLAGAEAAQNAALDSLRRGAEQLAAQMRDGDEQGGRPGSQSLGEGENEDPLGRSQSGSNPNARINDGEGGADPLSTRQIFDEIRRRAEDPNRPEAEREYLRRLLDRFGDS